MSEFLKALPVPPLGHAAGRDHMRPVMKHVYIDGNIAVATDAYVLVFINLLDYFDQKIIDALQGQLVLPNEWNKLSAALKKNKFTNEEKDRAARMERVRIFERNHLVFETSDGKLLMRLDNNENSNKYPNWRIVWDGAVEKKVREYKSAVNPKVMSTVFKAMGYPGQVYMECRAYEPEADGTILAAGYYEEQLVYGLCMPVMREDWKDHKFNPLTSAQ